MKKFTTMLTALGIGASSLVFADAAPAKSGNPYQMLIMIGIAIAFFYLIVLRPERKRRKEAQLRRESLKKGDKVTAMGILGHVAQIKEDTVVLKLYDGAKMEILKAAVSEVMADGEVTVEDAAEAKA